MILNVEQYSLSCSTPQYSFYLYDLHQKGRDTVGLELRIGNHYRQYTVTKQAASLGLINAILSIKNVIIADIDENNLQELVFRNHLIKDFKP